MKIQNVYWIDKDNNEAIVTVVDNQQMLDCFSCPFTYDVGDIIDNTLECLDVISIECSMSDTCEIKRKNNTFGYDLIGKMENVNRGIIKVYGFSVHIDEDMIPNDIIEGMYVKVSTSRIDIW